MGMGERCDGREEGAWGGSKKEEEEEGETEGGFGVEAEEDAE